MRKFGAVPAVGIDPNHPRRSIRTQNYRGGQICHRALRCGQVLRPDAVAITNGCTEALSLALRAVTKRGDAVAIESPTYFGLLQVLDALELQAIELPTATDAGLDIAALEKVLATKPVKARRFSSSFNNPLGCSMTDDG
jgi:DNA-binding transcriptional MocR family regulator